MSPKQDLVHVCFGSRLANLMVVAACTLFANDPYHCAFAVGLYLRAVQRVCNGAMSYLD
jgi:hypothetical protein